jgi:hypothetical protein
VSDELNDLHDDLFGFIPKKAGTAYERITAVVLAVLGWQGVQHDVDDGAAGKHAKHQLDVVARHPSGEVTRLIVECKHYATTIGEGTMDTLVGVMHQLGVKDAAVVTTKGFTKGALAVAEDEDIALIVLRHYDPATETANFVKKVQITINALVPEFTAFDVVRAPATETALSEFMVALHGDDRLLYLDGSPAESFAELLKSQSSPPAAGEYDQRVDFSKPRLLSTIDGEQIAIVALTWKEILHEHTSVVTSEMKGDPVLVIQQLDANGEPVSGHLVVSEDLYAWQIDSDGHVLPRGQL